MSDPVARFDRVILDTTKIRMAADGAMVVPCRFARTGVQEYADETMPDGIRRELREETDVEASAPTFEGVLLTDLHPKDPPYMVAPENARDLWRGHLQDVVYADGWLGGNCHILDRDEQLRVHAGERTELSAGYMAVHDVVPGSLGDEQYDVIQREITGNHVALIPGGTARAGSEARLLLDSTKNQRPPGAQTRSDMAVELEGKAYNIEVSASNGGLVIELLPATEDAESEEEQRPPVPEPPPRDPEKDTADAVTAQRDVSAAQLAELRREIRQLKDPTRLDSAVKARSDLIDQAHLVGGKDLDVTGSDTEIRVRALEARKISMKGRSDTYIQAAFDMAGQIPGDDGSLMRVAKQITSLDGDLAEEDPFAALYDARDRMLEG